MVRRAVSLRTRSAEWALAAQYGAVFAALGEGRPDEVALDPDLVGARPVTSAEEEAGEPAEGWSPGG